MMRRRFLLLGVMALAVALAIAAPSRADLVVNYQEDAGPIHTVTLAVGSPGLFPGLAGTTSFSTTDFHVVLQSGEAFQASPNTQLLGATTSITNSSHSTHTLTLTLYASGYTSPVIPPPALLASSLGGSVAIGSPANVLSFQSWANTNSNGSTTGASTGSQTANITASNTAYSTGTGSVLINSLGTPFELVEQIKFTLGGGSKVNYSSSTTLTATPEPTTMVMAMTGLPVLGFYLRRRRVRVQA